MNRQEKRLDDDDDVVVGSERERGRGKKKRGLHTHGAASALTVQKVTWNGKIQCLPTTQLGGGRDRER